MCTSPEDTPEVLMEDLDVGTYHYDKKLFKKLMTELYTKYPEGVTLPPEYADQVENNALRILTRFARYKFAARLVKKKDRILEIGCGSGLGCIFLGQHSSHVTGIDANSTEIKEAEKINRRRNVTFEVQDLFALEVNRKFDVIVALDVIEHMNKRDAHKFLSAIMSHLQPNGMLVLGTPSIYSYKYQGALSRASHIHCYDQQELLDLVDKYFGRTLPFSMNDEIVHTGHPKMAWYYFVLGFLPKYKVKS